MSQSTGQIAYMTEPGKLELRSYPVPETLESGALLLRVLQSNVCGSDIHIFGGHHPILKKGGLGHEMVGEIIATGGGRHTDSAGRPIRIGDRVVPVYTNVCHSCENCDRGITNHCDNAFAFWGQTEEAPHFHGATFATHYYLHPEQPFYRVPDAVPTSPAASANCALSQVLYGLDKAGVKPGDNVVVQGAGGLGQYAAAAANVRGARVVVMDRVPDRLEMVRRFGAETTINIDEMTGLDDRVAAVSDIFGTQGADVVIEVTGVPAVFAEGISYLRPQGIFVVMGTISPGQTAEFDPGTMVRKSAQILGINRYPPHYLRDALEFLERFGDRFPILELSEKTFSLGDAARAIEASARREVQRAAIIP